MLVMVALVTGFLSAQEAKVVEVEGRSLASGGNSRAEALADALREAVRVGVGVDVVDQSQTRDFQLDFDRVFTSSMGFVKEYRVLTTGIGADGFYRVKIKAEVAPGTPGEEEKLIFRMLSRSREKPRLMIRLEEKVNGTSGGATAAQWFGKLAVDLGVAVVDTAGQGSGIVSDRARILGRGQEADLRNAGVVSGADYILEGTVTSNAGEPTAVFGTKRRMCSVDISLRIIDAVSRQVVVSDTLEARRFAMEEALSPDIACRESIRRSLEESPDDTKARPGMRPVRMLFTHWIAEMDLGSMFRVELTRLGLDQAERLRSALSGRDKVSAVWVRSVDPAGVSVLDVESRLDGITLAKSIVDAAGGGFELDRSDNRYLSLRPGNAPTPSQVQTSSPAPEGKTSASGLPVLPISGAVLGIAALAFASGKYLARKKT